MKRDQSIETVRGLAILLVVIGHVIGIDEATGLMAEDDSFLRWFFHLPHCFLMPLFTIVSGYVYAFKPLKKDKVIPFSKGRIMRLGIPLLSISTLQFLTKAVVADMSKVEYMKGIWRIYLFSYDQFWFLQAIILVFSLLIILEYNNLLDSFQMWLIFFLLSIAHNLIFPFSTQFFSLYGFTYLLPSFLLGIGINRFSLDKKKNLMVISGALFLICLILQQLAFFKYLNLDITLTGKFGVIYGLIASFFIFGIKKEFTPLVKLGYYSFEIFLFHIFGLSGSRVIIEAFGIQNKGILFFTSLLCGLYFPILVNFIIDRSQLSRFILLGKQPKTVLNTSRIIEKMKQSS